MDGTRIAQVAKGYFKSSLRIVVGLTLAALVVTSVWGSPALVAVPLLVSVLFSLAASWGYGTAWKWAAKSSPSTLSKLYLAASVFRMLAAALVVLAYCLVVRERGPVLWFAGIFCGYYVVLLAFDCVYFAKVEKHTGK